MREEGDGGSLVGQRGNLAVGGASEGEALRAELVLLDLVLGVVDAEGDIGLCGRNHAAEGERRGLGRGKDWVHMSVCMKLEGEGEPAFSILQASSLA